jgi:dynein intermediate chain 2
MSTCLFVCLSVCCPQVGDTMLSSIAVQASSPSQPQLQGGKLVAVGDVAGTVTLLELCDSLAVPQPNERKAVDQMFEREIKQEKNLEARERDLRRQKSAQEQTEKAKEIGETKVDKEDKMEALLRKVSESFCFIVTFSFSNYVMNESG